MKRNSTLLIEHNEQNNSEQCRCCDMIMDSRFPGNAGILFVIVSYMKNMFCFCENVVKNY